MVEIKNLRDEELVITKEGKKNYEERLNYLLNVKREQVLKELSEAREQGDLSENADYDSAKEKQAEVEGEIKKIKSILENSVIASTHVDDMKVMIGSIVSIEKDGKSTIVKVVGKTEANPFVDPIEVEINSPIGNAILGGKIGETKSGFISDKLFKVKIIKIQH